MTRKLKEIEHEANTAVWRSDARFWIKQRAAQQHARERGDLDKELKIRRIGKEQKVTESYDKLLGNLKKGKIKGGDFIG